MSTRYPAPTHVRGTNRGEQLVQQKGREPGRSKRDQKRGYRSARDATGVNPQDPIDPHSPSMPPA